MTLSRIVLFASVLSAAPIVIGAAQARPFDPLSPLPSGATWDTLYRVFHEHQFVDDGVVAEAFSDFVVHQLATRWSSVTVLARLITTDSAFGVLVIKHIDATTDEAELRRVQDRSTASCPPRTRSLCGAIHVAARQAAAQAAQPK